MWPQWDGCGVLLTGVRLWCAVLLQAGWTEEFLMQCLQPYSEWGQAKIGRCVCVCVCVCELGVWFWAPRLATSLCSPGPNGPFHCCCYGLHAHSA